MVFFVEPFSVPYFYTSSFQILAKNLGALKNFLMHVKNFWYCLENLGAFWKFWIHFVNFWYILEIFLHFRIPGAFYKFLAPFRNSMFILEVFGSFQGPWCICKMFYHSVQFENSITRTEWESLSVSPIPLFWCL